MAKPSISSWGGAPVLPDQRLLDLEQCPRHCDSRHCEAFHANDENYFKNVYYYITPTLVSNTKFIGNVVYDLVGVAGNQPLAAAYTMVPVTIMLLFLFVARRLGAFGAL